MPVVKAAAVQLSPVLYSREGTVGKVVKKILELGRQGVQFATFPETVVPYYPYFSFVEAPYLMGAEHYKLLDQAVTVPSDATRAIADAAKQAGMVVSIGVNERDGSTIYNAQLLFDADGTLIQHRRKISPTYHERMVWGQGDGSGLRCVDSAVGRIGQLACWEHYNPLARYALMADGEQIHSAMYPGSFAGDGFSEQISVNIRQHALEAGCGLCDRLAGRRAASPDHEGHRLQHRAYLQRLLHGDRLARGRIGGRATALGRRRGHRGSRFLGDRQAQAPDGLARPLQSPGTAQPVDQSYTCCSCP